MTLITSSPVQLGNEYLLQCAEHLHGFLIEPRVDTNSRQFTMWVVGKSYPLPILPILIDLLEARLLSPSPGRLQLLVCPHTPMIAIFSGYSESQIDVNTKTTVLVTNPSSTVFQDAEITLLATLLRGIVLV